MRTIPQTYSKNGFDYKLVERDVNAAIYSQTHHASGKLCAYEVIAIRRRKARDDGVVKAEAAEVLPSTEQWGREGWTCWTLADAKKRFLALVDSRAPRLQPAGKTVSEAKSCGQDA